MRFASRNTFANASPRADRRLTTERTWLVPRAGPERAASISLCALELGKRMTTKMHAKRSL